MASRRQRRPARGPGRLLAIRRLLCNRSGVNGLRAKVAAERVLGRRSFRTLQHVADALVPAGGAFPLGAGDTNAAAGVVRLLAGSGRLLLAGLRACLVLWECGPLLSGRGRCFSALTREERRAYTGGSLRSAAPWRRPLLSLLKPLCLAAFTAHPRVTAAIGFTGECVESGPPRTGPRLHPLAYPDIHGAVDLRADACVVGSGAGGAVVAKELAERGFSVVVVEEGPYVTREDFQGPLLERSRRLYRDGGLTMAAGLSPVPIPLGKAVGGTTVINSGTCFRTPERVLREWVSRWGLDWAEPAAMARLFDRVEQHISVRPVPEALLGENARVFRRGVEALNLHGAPIRRNIEDCHGCGVCAFGCPRDAKQAMHRSYLPLAEAAGAAIYARCRVRAIEHEDGRATGVQADILDARTDAVRGRLRVRSRVVVLAAGAIYSPLLLFASGLANPGGPVGRNLRIHPATSVLAHFDQDVYAWRGTLQSFYVDDFQESDGLLFEVTSPLPGLSTMMAPVVGRPLKAWLASYHRLAAVGLFVADTSAGRVRRLPAGATLITYRLNQYDAARLARGVRIAGRIFFAAGARTVYSGLPGMEEIRRAADLEELARATGRGRPPVAGFHPMGTVRMGGDPEQCAVDPTGECYGTRNLFVADASVFPTCVGVNPQVSIMAVATWISEQIARRLEDLR